MIKIKGIHYNKRAVISITKFNNEIKFEFQKGYQWKTYRNTFHRNIAYFWHSITI